MAWITGKLVEYTNTSKRSFVKLFVNDTWAAQIVLIQLKLQGLQLCDDDQGLFKIIMRQEETTAERN